MKLGRYELDYSTPLFIGEVGINHNGDVDVAKKLIDYCVDYGWHFVKFQKRTVDEVYTKEQLNSLRNSPFGTTYREQKEGLEFGLEEYKEIDAYCKHVGIQWTASPWDIQSLDFLVENFDLPFIKISSACATDKELLLKATFADKPLVVSVGGCTEDQIYGMFNVLRDELSDNLPIILLHCVPIYPCDNADTALFKIRALKERDFFRSDVYVGYSGHEHGILPSVLAGVEGVAVIERHITIDRGMYGSDQGASLEPSGMKRVIAETYDAIKMNNSLGSFNPTKEEMKAINSLRLVDTV